MKQPAAILVLSELLI